MEQIKNLALRIEAFSSAMQGDKELFVPVTHYVKEIGRVFRLAHPEQERSLLSTDCSLPGMLASALAPA